MDIHSKPSVVRSYNASKSVGDGADCVVGIKHVCKSNKDKAC